MSDLNYKNYSAEVCYSKEDRLLVGRVLNVEALILFSADNVDDLETEFKAAVDSYLEDCRISGLSAEKPYKGSFNVRIGPENHRRAAAVALAQGATLNDFVRVAIERAISAHDHRDVIRVLQQGVHAEVGGYDLPSLLQSPAVAFKAAYKH